MSKFNHQLVVFLRPKIEVAMSGKNLTFKLIMDGDSKGLVAAAKQSEQVVSKVFEAIKQEANQTRLATNNATQGIDQLGKESTTAAVEVKKLDSELANTNVELSKTNAVSNEATKGIKGLKTGYTALTSAMAALGIGASATEISRTADEFKVLEARIGLVTSKSGNFTQAFEGVKKIAIETRSNLTATAELFTRVKTATDQLGYSQERALNLTDLVNKSLIVGGGLAASNEAAIYQFNQALQSGVLRGEEFNSVMEQAPRLARALADGLDVNIGKLRAMAGEGKLTSEVIVKALESQSKALNAEFGKMPVTIGQSIENLKTAWTLYIGEADAATGASTKVAEAIKFVAENLEVLVSTLTTVAQAYVAYKALGIAASFLEKANAAKIAQAAIATETASIVTNTQAQLINTRATQVAIVAKNQLTAATNASNTANVAASGVIGRVSTAANGLKGSIAGVLSRFGAYGAAAAGVILASDLIVDGLKKTDEWLLKQGSDFIDWAVSRSTGTKSLADQEKEFIAAEEASRKKQEEVAAAKAKNAERTEMLKNASLGLNEASKATVVEFEKLVKEGAKVSDVFGQIAKSFNFSTTTGINDGLTALLALQTQGKATAEEIRKALTGILSDEDLVKFQGRLAAIPVNIEKQLEATNTKIKAKQLELDNWKKANSDMNQKDWDAQVEKQRAGIGKLQAEASALHVQYANSVQGAAMVQGAILDEAIRRTGLSYEELQGKSTKAFEKASSDVSIVANNMDELKNKGVDVGRALDASISNAINTATNQQELDALKLKIEDLRGVLGSKVADGLLQQAGQQLIDVKNKADEARSGINSTAEAFSLFGMKTPEQLKGVAEQYKQAFTEMKNSGQATLHQQQEAFKQYAEKAIAANKGIADSTITTQAYMLGLDVQVDATGKATVSKLGEIQQAAIETQRTVSQVSQATSREQPEISPEQQATNDHWDDFKAKMKARTDELNAKSQARGSGGGNASLLSNGGDSTQQISAVPDAPLIATSFDIQGIENMQPTEKKVLELQSGGKAAELQGTPEAVDSVEEMLREFEMLKRSM